MFFSYFIIKFAIIKKKLIKIKKKLLFKTKLYFYYLNL